MWNEQIKRSMAVHEKVSLKTSDIFEANRHSLLSWVYASLHSGKPLGEVLENARASWDERVAAMTKNGRMREGFRIEPDLDCVRRNMKMWSAETRPFNFLWFDLETTGLDPHDGEVLEFAAVLCRDDRDFGIEHEFSSVVRFRGDISKVDPYVVDMHTKNGLWKESTESDIDVKTADLILQHIAEDVLKAGFRSIHLAGFNPGFDLMWSRVHFPVFSKYLSHRSFDIRALTSAVEVWCGYTEPFVVSNHRAENDVRAAIQTAANCREFMF